MLRIKKYNKVYNKEKIKNQNQGLSNMTRDYREFLYLLSLLQKPFGLWVILPTNKSLKQFCGFLVESKIIYRNIYMKSSFGRKLFSFNGFSKNISRILPPNGSFFFSFSELKSFSKALSYFFKDDIYKGFTSNFSSKFNLMSGAVIFTKFFDFIIPSNLSFFSFFLDSIMLMKVNALYFNFLFIRTTMVVIYSIMLIISFFKMTFWRFMSLNTRLFINCISYANKKSVS